MSESSARSMTGDDEQLHDLIAEFHSRRDRGELIEPTVFVSEHPEVGAELSRYFQNVSTLEGLAGPRADESAAEASATVVAADTHNGTAVETLIQESQAEAPSVRIASDAPLSRFGRYHILQELGRGAMGAVYLAHDEQLDRQVALKIPQFGQEMDRALLERFYREARAAAALRHPGICPVFDVGELNGQHYITMAFIKGRPLRDFTKTSKTQGIRQIVRVIRKLALALAEAHRHKVVHRDLKPANIMIDERKEPVVMDFGLARRTAEREEKLTHSGTVIGTPAYMSPEQVDGDNNRVGPTADIYSLGVIFYELVTGQLPFQGHLMSILKQIATVEPQPPSELRPDLPNELQAVIQKMMAKEIEVRYQSMDEVAAVLTEFLKDQHAATDESGMMETSRVSSRNDRTFGDLELTDARTVPQDAQPSLPQINTFPLPSGQILFSNDRSPARRKRIGLALAAVAALMAGIAFFVRLGKYDVQITIDDPSISLQVDGEAVTVNGNGSPIRLSAGSHKLRVQHNGLESETEQFVVRKDGKNAVHVAIVNGKLTINSGGQSDDPDKALPDTTRRENGPPGNGQHTELAGTASERLKSRPGRTSSPLRSPVTPGTQPPVGTTTSTLDPENYALEFRPGSRIEIPSLSRPKGPFTVEALVRIDEPLINRPIITGRGTSLFTLHRTLGFSLIDAPAHVEGRTAQRLDELGTRMIHIAGFWDGSSLQCFVDGVSNPINTTVSSDDNNSGNDPFMIGYGKIDGTDKSFAGVIDEVRISSSARYPLRTEDLEPLLRGNRFTSDKQTLALYHFDEGTGDVLHDSSGNGHDGRIVDALWTRIRVQDEPQKSLADPEKASEAANYALAFNSGSRVEIPDLRRPDGPFTVEALVRFAEPLITKPIVTGHGTSLFSIHNTLGFALSDGPALVESRTAQHLDELGTRMVHIAGVWDGNSIQCFVDGVSTVINTKITNDSNDRENTPFRIGYGTINGIETSFAGVIDEVRISSWARYTSRAKNLKSFNPVDRFASDGRTLVLYHFDEGSGDLAKDSSGNGYDGTITAAKWVSVDNGATIIP